MKAEWKRHQIAHLIAEGKLFIGDGYRAKNEELAPSGLPFARAGNINDGFKFQRADCFPEENLSRVGNKVSQPGDVVFTSKGTVGRFAFVSEDGLTASTGFAVLRPVRAEYAEFVYLAATAGENIESLSHLADGGAYPAVLPEVVAATRAIRPGDDVIERFSRVAEPLLGKAAQNEHESRTLAALRDAMLPKLLSGEIRVRR